MKKVFYLVLCATLLFSSCSTTMKLIGNYSEGTEMAESPLPYDEVWSKIIDYFAMSGMPITNIDKESGLIVSSNVSFLNSYTREDKKGNLVNPEAYVVIPTLKGVLGNILEPDALFTGRWEMTGDWNVRIKKVSEYTTLINVNLLNLRCFYDSGGLLSDVTKIPIKSTGVFERSIMEYLQNL